MLKAGTYNDVVRENLPPQHQTGTIRRRDFGMSGRMQESTSSRISRLRMLRSSLKGPPHRKKIMLR